MKNKSIRFRLTLWYTGVLALALLAFGAFSWIAIREVLLHAVDEVLEDRVRGVQRFMENQIGSLSVEEIRDEFKEHSVLGPGGDLFQVCDAQGVWLYRSASLEDASVPIEVPARLAPAGIAADRIYKGATLRLFSRPVIVLGQSYTVQVASLTGEIEEGLVRYRSVLLLLIPAILAVAFAGGWWLSGRALAPVDDLTATARSIGDRNLSQRLPVPPTDDELARLSTTLNQMLDRIESGFRRIAEFTADASHELRTPIALIRTTAELALRKQREPAEYREALREVLHESERTTALIENLLTLARADAGRAQLDLSRFDLAELLGEVSEQAAKLATVKRQTFQYSPAGQPLPVSADSSALRRLFLILLDNAVKYTGEGGSISLVATVHQKRIHVEVRDDGIGIPADDLPRIFERFYRADKSRNRDSGGAGLGLSLAKWIAEAHHAELTVESTAGSGSTFQISLTREEPLA